MNSIHNTTATFNEHPAQEALTEFALGEGGQELGEHVGHCAACTEYVEDIRKIRHAISTFPEVEPPPELYTSILREIKRREHPWLSYFTFDFTIWYRNPVWIGLMLVMAVLFVYIFMNYVL